MRDPSLEAYFDALGIPWQYHDSVLLSKVNVEKSLKNQARITEDPLNPDAVRQYKDAKRNGDKFPAIVTYEDGEDFVALDGNHRIAADLQNDVKTTDMYEILSNPEDRLTLAYSLNTRVSPIPQSEADRDAHAVAMVHQGFSRDAVARALHIRKPRIEEALTIADAQVRANRLGAKSAWSNLPTKSVKVELSRGFVDDAVFVKAVKIASKYVLKRDGARQLRNLTDAQGSEQLRLDALALEEKRLEREKKRAAGKRVMERKNPRAMSTAWLEAISQHFESNVKEFWTLGLTDDEREEFRDRLRQAKHTLEKVESIIGA